MGIFQDTVTPRTLVNAATKRTQELIETKGSRYFAASFVFKCLLPVFRDQPGCGFQFKVWVRRLGNKGDQICKWLNELEREFFEIGDHWAGRTSENPTLRPRLTHDFKGDGLWLISPRRALYGQVLS
jgi:hypothetical protein